MADGQQRLKAAKELAMEEVSAIRLPIEEVDRRLLRQVLLSDFYPTLLPRDDQAQAFMLANTESSCLIDFCHRISK